jgi:putative endonuclease
MDEFVVYVLFSEKYNKIYVGYTSALIDRFTSHNALAKSGYTFKFRPWIVVHTEFFSQKKDAMIREKQLKSSQGRAFIRTQILSYI